jgi:hypothetical protein
MLLPGHRRPGGLELFASKWDRPHVRKLVQPTRRFEALNGSVLGWQIIEPDPNTTYEGHWVLE